ncbi:hypothetical protein D5018_12255 [Parashewanella curva]|uniref:Uncharacterized protein n=1 Tax=Parashewanella curva TaxID=2338552 RepID=A0A3L8PY63_9GAMM|nr:hypothetical protein [Parashewanella curva]RLV59398.1 hypothetical protein D5018_12255 [Parashewanella curva]
MTLPKLSKQVVQYEVARHVWEGKDLSSITLSNGKTYSVGFGEDGVLSASRKSEYSGVKDAVKSLFMYCLKLVGIDRRTSDYIVQSMYEEHIHPSNLYDDDDCTIPNGAPFLTNVCEWKSKSTFQEQRVINQSFNVPEADNDIKFTRAYGFSRKTCPILNKRLNHKNAIVLIVNGKPITVSREGLRVYFLYDFPDVNLGVNPSEINPKDIVPLTKENLTWRSFKDWLYQDVELEEAKEALPLEKEGVPLEDEEPSFVKEVLVNENEAKPRSVGKKNKSERSNKGLPDINLGNLALYLGALFAPYLESIKPFVSVQCIYQLSVPKSIMEPHHFSAPHHGILQD